MHPARPKVTTVDEYLELFEGEAKAKLIELRAIIRAAVPDAQEVISYAIPAYKYHGWLVYFSGYAKHVSVSFPPQSIMKAFENELGPYKSSKSTVQFPLDQPLPKELIREMLAYKVKENLETEAEK
jgi:uncharacterized protein YdhG (YjbR/CyaY superfamily)